MPTVSEIHDRTTRVRLVIVDTLEQLRHDDWSTATLCSGWDVRTLVAHLGQPMVVGTGRMILTLLWCRGDIDAAVDATARRLARRPVPDLIATIRDHAADRVSPPRVGAHGPFVDACVHLRDLARPLGLDADARTDDWVAVLAYLTSPAVVPTLVPRGRLDGLHLHATDVAWEHGAGADVIGPVEALAMAVCGRAVACLDLAGPGVETMQRRITAA